MSKLKKFLAVFAIILTMPLGAAAYYSANDRVVISEPINENAYIAGEAVIVRAQIDGDLFVATESLTIDAPVNGDLLVFARDVIVNAQVDGDIRGAAQRIVLNADVAGDVLAAGQDITLAESKKVAKNLFLAGEDIVIDGTVSGSAHIASSSASFGTESDVLGSIDLYDMSDVHVTFENAALEEKAQMRTTNHAEQNEGGFGGAFAVLISLLGTLLFVILYPVLLVSVARKYVGECVSTTLRDFAMRAGIGLVGLVVMPVLIVLSMISGIGIPLGVFLLLAWMLLLILAVPAAAVLLGVYVTGLYRQKKQSGANSTLKFIVNYPSALIGSILMLLIILIPLIGFLIFLAFMLAALGAILQFLFVRLRHAMS